MGLASLGTGDLTGDRMLLMVSLGDLPEYERTHKENRFSQYVTTAWKDLVPPSEKTELDSRHTSTHTGFVCVHRCLVMCYFQRHG